MTWGPVDVHGGLRPPNPPAPPEYAEMLLRSPPKPPTERAEIITTASAERGASPLLNPPLLHLFTPDLLLVVAEI